MIEQLPTIHSNPFYQWMRKAQTWLLPPTCILCNSQSKRNIDLCSACEEDLPWVESACIQCGLPFSDQHTDQMRCGSCLQSLPPYNKTFSLCHYEQPISRLITQLKFHHKLNYATILGRLMAKRLYDTLQEPFSKPESIIPVPLHKHRLRKRGYNQALEIARPIAKHLQIPLDVNACERIRATEAQSAVAANKRHENVRNAFRVRRPIAAKHVMIVDDVMTTGHTVTELSKVLRKAGAREISIWCCARTSI